MEIRRAVLVCLVFVVSVWPWETAGQSTEAVLLQMQQDINRLEAELAAAKQTISVLQVVVGKEVAFTASINKDLNHISAHQGETIPFSVILVNTGEGWNNNTNVFTAPYDGNYFFIVSVDVSPNYDRLHVVKNGQTILTADKDDDVTTHLSASGVVHLAARDAVYVTHDTNSGHLDSGRDCTFSGFLIG